MESNMTTLIHPNITVFLTETIQRNATEAIQETPIFSFIFEGQFLMWWQSVVSGELPDVSLWLTATELPNPAAVVWILCLVAVLRFLHIFSSPATPEVTICDGASSEKTSRMRQLVDGIHMLRDPYRPPPLWGRSGHVQTAAYGLLGHATLKRTADRRCAVRLPDGSTVTFDVFEPVHRHESGSDITLTLTPGIANSSESNYIRTCVHHAQENGYRCAVLNHLGALSDVKLTGNRIFSYGGTEELTAMMTYLADEYPQTRFISVGFSMGANITTRFVLEMSEQMRSRVLLGLSVAQGYSATNSSPMYHDWENCRRAYNYMITENMKRLLRRHYERAVAPHAASGLVDEQRLWATTSIIGLDELYSRRVTGFSSVEKFYEWVSCLPHLDTLRTPMVFLNAVDDPIVPDVLWQPVRDLASRKSDVAFVLTKHGGHLGFLEGGSMSPRSVTWLDRFIVKMADEAVKVYG